MHIAAGVLIMHALSRVGAAPAMQDVCHVTEPARRRSNDVCCSVLLRWHCLGAPPPLRVAATPP